MVTAFFSEYRIRTNFRNVNQFAGLQAANLDNFLDNFPDCRRSDPNVGQRGIAARQLISVVNATASERSACYNHRVVPI